MFTSRLPRLAMALALAAALVLAAAADAAVISFSVWREGFSDAEMNPGDLAGAPGVRVANWNNFSHLETTLGDDEAVLYDDGSTVAGGFQMDAALSAGFLVGNRSSGLTNDPQMFAGVVDERSANGTMVSFTDIPFDQYDIYAYWRTEGAGADFVAGFTIGGTTYYARDGISIPDASGNGYIRSADTTITDNTPSSVDRGNYVQFEGLTGSSQSLHLFAASSRPDDIDRNKWSGFQIVDTTPASAQPIPEPAAALLSLAAAGALALRRTRG
jgi:hypothetical protein